MRKVGIAMNGQELGETGGKGAAARHMGLMLILVAAVLAAPLAHAAVDPLDRPALMSPLAAGSVLVGASRAGARVLVAGERGHILYTDEKSSVWQQAHVPVSVTLTAIRFADEKHGWAVGHGGVILRSDDGGQTWTRQMDGRTAAALILKAAEAGGDQAALDLAHQFVADGPDKPFLDIYAKSEKEGLAIGAYGLLFATSDGGATWAPALDRLSNPDARHLYAIRRIGTDLLIVGEQGRLYRSRDGGQSFERLAPPDDASLFGLIGWPDGTGLAFGLRGALNRTIDGGDTWMKVKPPTTASLAAGLVLDDGSAILADQDGYLWRSWDRGASFCLAHRISGFSPADLVQLVDGELLVVGSGGTARVQLSADAKAGCGVQ